MKIDQIGHLVKTNPNKANFQSKSKKVMLYSMILTMVD
jgi:hypothetical protein